MTKYAGRHIYYEIAVMVIAVMVILAVMVMVMA